MRRYNTFNNIHKSLRTLLYDASLGLQQTNFTQPDEVETTFDKVRVVLEAFDEHAHHEDTFILPAIEKFDSSVSHAFAEEHVLDSKLAKDLSSLLEDFFLRHSDTAKEQAGAEICKAFIAFMVFNLNHMAKEEDLLNALLWKYYSDEEIIAIQQKLVSTIPPAKMEFSARWMLRGLNNPEIKMWLKAVENAAPVFVFQHLIELAEAELPVGRYTSIMESITDGAMLA